MNRALATIALLILSNTFMTLAWYGHIAFKSKIERFGMLSIILLSWGIALFEYCFQVPANRIGMLENKFNAKSFHQFILNMDGASFRVIKPYFQTWLMTEKLHV